MFKSGFVAIVGKTNAGKSTFLNAVLKEKIAITSRKPQTTRKNLKGIYNDDETQIVFVDTPGIHIGKNKLDEYMDLSIKKAIVDVDVILFMIDILTFESDNFEKEIDKLKQLQIPKILLINKIDYISEDEVNKKINKILDIFDVVKFNKYFLISSLRNKNIKNVIDIIKSFLSEGPKYFDDFDLTDTSTKEIIAEMIRQQCLYKLDKEIPHGIVIDVLNINFKKTKVVEIIANIICERESHKKIIIGNKGSMIKNIGIASRISIEKFLNKKVNIKLFVLVKDNWRNETLHLIDLGFDNNKI